MKGAEVRRELNVHGDLLLCGELKKKSSKPPKRYLKRYFEAVGHYLNYYADENKTALKGTLDMDDCVDCELDGLTLVLTMNSSSGHKVMLKADNAALAKHWFEGLSVLTKEEEEDSEEDDEDDEKSKGKKTKLVYPPDRTDVIWFSLTILKAKGLPAKDFGGTSDPYFSAHVDERDAPKKSRLPRVGRTTTIVKSLDPDWGASNNGFGQELGSFVPRDCKVIVECHDESRGMLQRSRALSGAALGGSGDIMMGKLTIDISALPAGAREYQWYDLEKSKGSVMIAINVWDHKADTAHAPITSATTKDGSLPPLWSSASKRIALHMCAFHANANTSQGSTLYYPYNRVVEHVLEGKEATERVMLYQPPPEYVQGSETTASTQSRNEKLKAQFANKHEVNCFCWYMLYKSVEKRQEFVSGSWLVQDPGHKLATAISHLSYSRKLMGSAYSKSGETSYDKKTFGSTHYIDLLMHMDKMGSAYMPEDPVAIPVEKGGKSLGYYQNGVDIDESHDDGTLNGFPLFFEKAHLVTGKVPSKYPEAQWLFVKCETFGTQRVTDQIGHLACLGQTISGASKGPKHLRGAKRTENPDKRRVKRFCSLVEGICQKPLTRRFLRSDLSCDELKQRAKVMGMSFMYPKVREIHAKVAKYLDESHVGGGNAAHASGTLQNHNQCTI
jgi:hypothetical protein